MSIPGETPRSGPESAVTSLLFGVPTSEGAGALLMAAVSSVARQQLMPGVAFKVAERLPATLTKHAPDGAMIDLETCGSSMLVAARGEPNRVARSLVTLIDEIRSLIDLPRSLVVTGEEVVVKPDVGPIWVVMPVRRQAHLDRLAFQERWREGHADYGRRMAAPGYRQLHARTIGDDKGLTSMVAVNRHDGVAMVFYRSEEEMQRTRASPEVARDAMADEMQFIDHGRSSLALYRSSGGWAGDRAP